MSPHIPFNAAIPLEKFLSLPQVGFTPVFLPSWEVLIAQSQKDPTQVLTWLLPVFVILVVIWIEWNKQQKRAKVNAEP